MFPSVPQQPVITAMQKGVAEASHLVRDDAGLVFGFSDNVPFTVAVSMQTLHVDWTDDEAFSDDALESTWQFRVHTGASDTTGTFVESTLGSGNRTLPPHLWFPGVILASDTDELIIEVTGTDWDFWSPNDDLPKLEIKRAKGQDRWGTDSTNIQFGVMGEHKSEPVESGDIKYSLTSLVTLEAQPSETIFRTIC
jgi:hypothetical protein